MYYSRWADTEEIKENCSALNKNCQNDKAGIPVLYDNDKVYTLDPSYHTLVIGSEGSGKTQVAILPLIKMSMNSNNSMVINDVRGDLYKNTKEKLVNNGYRVICLDYQDPSLGNSFNPLDIPYRLYQENNDKALKMVEEVGYYLLNDGKIDGDPFWENTAIDYFTGLALYLFEQGDENNISISSIYNLSNEINQDRKEFISKLDKKSNIYAYLTATLLAPPETYGSILSVFHQKIRKYIVGNNLKSMLNKSDFNMMDIINDKVAIFVISSTNDYSDHLVPLIFNQVYSIKETYPDSKQSINMIIDDFDYLIPMKNFIKELNYARSININYTVTVKTFTNLINTYGKETFEMMKLCFSNLIYLITNDMDTLKQISDYCGDQEKDKKLISVDELKRLKMFEAIILVVRCMPYRVNLIPDYKIEW